MTIRTRSDTARAHANGTQTLAEMLRRRPRRLRRTAGIRALVRETRLSPDNFIYPLFVCPGEGQRREVRSMPGVYQLSVDEAVREATAAKADGVPGVLLFGLPEEKDVVGSGAHDPEGPVQAAIRAIKQEVPNLLVITDVCLCEYTSHGHCGIIVDDEIANDVTVEQLARAALSHAVAGADIIAPSDMMDGRVGRIRAALDDAGFTQTAIMSYAAKYCSAFYGPFREAADSAPAFGDRRSHQMDPANVDEALREVALDIDEGADIVMGCVVNGPGESKAASIGISLPGTGESPNCPVYIDGQHHTTLRGTYDELAVAFRELVDNYVATKYPRRQ